MIKLPKYLVLDVSMALIPLFQLRDDKHYPTIDVDAILSGMIEALEKPNLTGHQLDGSVEWLLHAHGLTSTTMPPSVCSKAKGLIYLSVLLLRHQLMTINPYCHGRLPYHHKKRHGQRNVILQLNSDAIASDCDP